MALDIREGDILVAAGKDYPVKSCANWAAGQMSTPSLGAFRRMATIPASTKRAAIVDGKRTAAATYLAGLNVTPLDPVSAELAATAGLDTPAELVQTFVADSDGFVHLILEDLKR